MSIALPPETRLQTVLVEGTQLAYLELGSGEPVLFLHGNPTSSLLWREVIGPVADTGRRCLALDLVGMGRSGKPDIEYRLVDHIRYVEAFVEALGLTRLSIVGHDWGAVIALDHARRFPGRVRAVAFLEGHIHPIEHWSDLDVGGRDLFQRLREPGTGEQLVIEENFFLEVVLPGGMLRRPSDEEMQAYREPFLEPGSRVPMLRWPREIPIEGSPADVRNLVLANQDVIADPTLPKLLLSATPGAVITEAEVSWCREHGRSLTIADVGAGTHFLPLDQPAAIAVQLCRWLDALTHEVSST
jgi:haloalkane dehalogenase